MVGGAKGGVGGGTHDGRGGRMREAEGGWGEGSVVQGSVVEAGIEVDSTSDLWNLDRTNIWDV